MSENELKALTEFVERGNLLVISTYFLDQKIQEWLHLQTSFSGVPSKNDSIQALDMATGDYESFPIGRAWTPSIAIYDSSATDLQVLSRYTDGRASCISFKQGNGYVVIHMQPFMFSNYHLIKRNTVAYSELFFSALPGPLETIYWDEYFKDTGNNDMAPLKFVMSQPALKNAFWWALAGLLLLVFFSFKRRQRVIPVQSPLVNHSLDMVRTVSDMYFFSHKNEVMAKKKIAHWLEFLRTRYNIFTSLPPAVFWQAVAGRSDMPPEALAELQQMVEKHRNGEQSVSDKEMVRLSQLIDQYYKS